MTSRTDRPAEQAVREQAARLAETDRAKDELLATLSHELRNPLPPLRNSLVLMPRLDGAHPKTERLQEIMEEGRGHGSEFVLRLPFAENVRAADPAEIARAIRARPAQRQPILVALTGWGQETGRERARDAGFDHHLMKPAEIGHLENLLRSLGTNAPRTD